MSRPSPFFSVIIPSYNRKGQVVKAIDSVLSQDFPDFEILLIDDGSTDGTIDHLRERYHDERLKIHAIEHAGRSVARNKGLEFATGKWICFLDSDDQYLEGTLSAFSSKIQEYPQLKAFACELKVGLSVNTHPKPEKKPSLFQFKDFITRNPLVLDQLSYRSDLKLRFPEALSYAEDWYFFRTLSFNRNILKFSFIGVDFSDRPTRSMFTVGPHTLAAENLRSAELLSEDIPLTKQQKRKLILSTRLLCTNIVLSGTKDKKEAFDYFKYCLSLRALRFSNFYRALYKFMFF